MRELNKVATDAKYSKREKEAAIIIVGCASHFNKCKEIGYWEGMREASETLAVFFRDEYGVTDDNIITVSVTRMLNTLKPTGNLQKPLDFASIEDVEKVDEPLFNQYCENYIDEKFGGMDIDDEVWENTIKEFCDTVWNPSTAYLKNFMKHITSKN